MNPTAVVADAFFLDAELDVQSFAVIDAE